MLHSKSSVITSLSEVTVIEDLNCFEKKTFCNWSTLLLIYYDISLILKSFILNKKGKEFKIIFTYFLFFDDIVTLEALVTWRSHRGSDGTRSTDAPELMATFRPFILCPTVWGEALRKPSGRLIPIT